MQRAIDGLKQVRVAAPDRRVEDYPHQISGGMKQRVVGAIAISCEPKVIIADEPTTSLDVTIQAQYLRLLREIQEETNLALIFITHDFGIVAKMCDRVVVMYAGRHVESGPVREIFNHPSHPYTQALLRSVPSMDEDIERLYSIEGQPPALWDLPEGCRFAPRCPYADDRCRREYPPTFKVGKNGPPHRRLLATGIRMTTTAGTAGPGAEEALPRHPGVRLEEGRRLGAGRRRHRLLDPAGRDARHRRRVRLRQDDDRQARAAPGGADGRPGVRRRQGRPCARRQTP